MKLLLICKELLFFFFFFLSLPLSPPRPPPSTHRPSQFSTKHDKNCLGEKYWSCLDTLFTSYFMFVRALRISAVCRCQKKPEYCEVQPLRNFSKLPPPCQLWDWHLVPRPTILLSYWSKHTSKLRLHWFPINWTDSTGLKDSHSFQPPICIHILILIQIY